jgi:hypothetical protein
MKAKRPVPGGQVVGFRRRTDPPMKSTFSITKVTGAPPWMLATPGSHDQPSGNGSNAVVTTGSTNQQRPDGRPYLRLVRD